MDNLSQRVQAFLDAYTGDAPAEDTVVEIVGALESERSRLAEENRRLLTGDRVVYFPCKEHMGLPFTMTVGFAPPTICRCPICEPPPSPLSAEGNSP